MVQFYTLVILKWFQGGPRVSSTKDYSLALSFGEIGLSMRIVFPDTLSLASYDRHRWMVTRQESYTIIHAVPDVSELESSFWEVWYAHNGASALHHILYCYKPSIPYHDIFEVPPEPDGLLPEEVVGRTWYVVQDPSMMAWGVRKLLLHG